MQLYIIIAVTVFISILVKWLINTVEKCRNYPPGPWGIPVLGYIPWMSKKPYLTFMEISKKYGKVFSVTLGPNTIVVFNDWQSVKEALIEQPKIFSDRPRQHVTTELCKEKNLGFSGGPIWKKQRNLVLRSLKNTGIRLKSMESRGMDLVHDIMDKLPKHDGKVIAMESVFFNSILKMNWKMISGNDVHNASVDLEEFETIVYEMFKALSFDNPVNPFPWLRFFPPNGFGFWKYMKLAKKLQSYLKKVIDDHETNWKDGELNDFVDFYMADMKANGSSEPPYNGDHLMMSMWDLFLAGVDTVSSTCLWGFLYAAGNPDVQKKVQAELDLVIGRQHLPSLDDVPTLPYFEAFLMEVHRKSSVAPLSVPHKNSKAAVISGFPIPKDTTCLQNIYAVHHDPDLWENPDEFNPGRFLDENNKAKAPPYLMPFSLGPRVCVGQSIAEIELKLIFSCLLHQFSFSFPPGQPHPSLESDFRLAIQPLPYSLLIQKRQI